ncbi:hypothetical protein M427DRAFT_458512 [Gonapodya prolifera JEL478]|uniref:Uncharacterized protein n=1 Tax=Gonapodya prolifera (strain JEL478) TaxID=1344416 RepID=A0A139A234_GONPJ|nr:hypothetical protein M427DRAFT_458512 [Gonapodya prolifera JEL478]|eukprot:KXS10850.1 hypothetical protein M427DRAFT_458512 [Gonapodya prolifera JEL478]
MSSSLAALASRAIETGGESDFEAAEREGTRLALQNALGKLESHLKNPETKPERIAAAVSFISQITHGVSRFPIELIPRFNTCLVTALERFGDDTRVVDAVADCYPTLIQLSSSLANPELHSQLSQLVTKHSSDPHARLKLAMAIQAIEAASGRAVDESAAAPKSDDVVQLALASLNELLDPVKAQSGGLLVEEMAQMVAERERVLTDPSNRSLVLLHRPQVHRAFLSIFEAFGWKPEDGTTPGTAPAKEPHAPKTAAASDAEGTTKETEDDWDPSKGVRIDPFLLTAYDGEWR